MYQYKITLTIEPRVSKDQIFEDFHNLLSALYKNGQITGYTEPSFATARELVAFPVTLEKGSLSPKYNDDYVDVAMKRIQLTNGSIPVITLQGTPGPDYAGVCRCKQPAFYILFTHFLNDAGAIDCGSCGKVIPLYKLKQLAPDKKYNLYRWEADYKACDTLQMGCTVGEEWGIRQMSDPGSELSKQGLAVCQMIKESTGKPVYYYLHNYREISHQQDKARLCPSCNKPWLLKEPLLHFYNFKCDYCHLVSNFSPNSE